MTNQKNSLTWQLYKLQQRINEWWELKTQQIGENMPDNELFSWLDSELFQLLFRCLFWIILTIILAWIALKIYHLLYQVSYRNKLKFTTQSLKKGNINQKSIHDWLKRSQFFAQQANYKEAIKCLYMAMLQRLNNSGIALHEPSRTDAEYLDMIKQLPNYSSYQILLINHQKLIFSNHKATLSMWKESQQAYQIIDNLLNKISS
jgi:hypothetical protein